MAFRDWDIVGAPGDWVALRYFNGQEIAIKVSAYGVMPAAVAAYEAGEQTRMQARVAELGALVDGALDRLR